ncbi:MAG: ammonium transporter [Deltaproteobacteria bacterium]|nr:ammonium transporter [Deltaproteobacteria bacterium]
MTPEIKYIFDTLWLLLSGILVMWMAAGFAMLEAGLTQAKNTVNILTKNVVIYAAACLMYWMIGYQIMYTPGNAFMSFGFGLGGLSDGDHSLMSDFFFQVVFVATAASIVSGTVAERMKFWPFVVFTLLLTGIIYPIQGHWSWGGSQLGGLLSGFTDFAGSTIVHSVGGWAALSGVLLLGPRMGKYQENGGIRPMPGANMPLATLGTFILWLGWFGFNGGSQLALGSKADINAVGLVIVNTNMAACAGAITALALSQLRYGKIDLSMVLNGALSGLVAITAGPNYSSIGVAVLIGAIGGALVMMAVPMFDRLKIDDPVGALSVHLVNGIWGTLAVGIFNPEVSFWGQVLGVVTVGLFTFSTSYGFWYAIKLSMGLRVGEQEELDGIDLHEFGMEAYPAFAPQKG